ncbi:MAG: sugar transferase [Lachnospiraceae bacterium]|nr:sugar transferase [Lachnospiraceae bacterium]
MSEGIQKRKYLETVLVLAADLISIILSYLIALRLRYGLIGSFYRNEIYVLVGVVSILIYIFLYFLTEQKKEILLRGYADEILSVTRQNAVLLVAIAVFVFLFRLSEYFSRLVYGYFIGGNLIISYLLRLVVKQILRAYTRSGQNKVKTMIIADGAKLSEILAQFESDTLRDYQVVAVGQIEESSIPTLTNESGILLINGREDIIRMAKVIALDEVFLWLGSYDKKMTATLIGEFSEMGITCHHILDLVSPIDGIKSIEAFGDYTALSYRFYQSSVRDLFAKRLMDLAGGLVGILITLCLLPFIALAIKSESKGPIFFRQLRIGKNGRRFYLYKFRSMYLDAEQRKKDLMAQNEMSGYMFKMKDDPRITKVGKFLRNTSLDELPQFFNILKGDMSLVGTRPPTVDEFEKYQLHHRKRMAIKPGLTGMWQVSGRSDITDFEEVVALDTKYIEEWSIGLDVKILFQTVAVVFGRRGSR